MPATLFKKKTLTLLFSYEFSKIFRNTFLTGHVWVTASDLRKALTKYQDHCSKQR